MKPVLLIIDMQEEFFQEGRLAEHREQLVRNINKLVNSAHSTNIPVIWIRQEYSPDLSDAPLYNRKHQKPITIIGTSGAELLSELHKIRTDTEIIKKRFSSFFKTNLESILQENNIDTIIISGINTMTCVRTTAIDAYMRDYSVILALDCVDGHDEEQHHNSLTYLQYAVAEGKTNIEIIELLTKL